MWSGTSALNSIDQGMQSIRNEVVRLDQQLAQLTQSLAANQRHRVKIINDIAAVRLAGIESGEIQASLTAADHEAAQILQQRESALQVLNDDIEQRNRQIEALESERAGLLQEVNQASRNIVDIMIWQHLCIVAGTPPPWTGTT